MLRIYSLIVLFLICCTHGLIAQDMASDDSAEGDTLRNFEMPQILVVGARPGMLNQIPGAVSSISKQELTKIAPLTANEVLRKVPGLHLVDEEGAGLRINIGVRGLDPDRSRNILVLEDGIPVALNPYGESEMYFSPSIDKMSGVEVLKGNGQILFGPQTTGGVLNFITQDPPEIMQTQLRFRAGQGGFMSAYASHGNTVGKAGFLFSVLHKRADKIATTGFALTDISGKIKFEINEKSRLGLKIGFYNEDSDATYIGLTQTMYDAGGQDFVHMAPGDRLPVRRYNISLTHQWDITDRWELQTTGFAYSISRDWLRQNFSSSAGASNQTGVVWGDPDVPGGAVYMQNTSGNRNRQFEVAGVEARARYKGELLGKENHLEFGGRWLYERAYEQFIDGAKADATGGNMRDREVRTGYGLSAFVQDNWKVRDRVTVTVGLRMENYDYERHILRGRFLIDGSNQVRDTSVVAGNQVTTLIPGAGVNVGINDNWQLFAGVHRGFAPPRVKDAITAEGVAMDLDAEISTNYELGLRLLEVAGLGFSTTVFWMDFVNQIIPVSESSGNQNATGLANGGATTHRGAEMALRADIGRFTGSRHSFYVDLAGTFADSRFSRDRFVLSGSEQVNVNGNKLPYAPEWTAWTAVGADFDFGLGLYLAANYVGAQFTDEINSVTPAANGRSGETDSRWVLDASASYLFKSIPLRLHVSVKNLTDERYIASRRPQGIRVGLPRFITAGVDYTF